MAFQGIDIRQTGDRIVFRASLKDLNGAIITTGTANLRVYELQSDGSLKSYDFSSNTFKTLALTTESQALTHRTGNNGATNTGVWTYALTTLTGFTAGNLYIAKVLHASSLPLEQEREFQFGVSSVFDPFSAAPDVNVTKVAGAVQTAGDLAAILTTIATYVDTEVAAIKAKTDNLPVDPADASDIAAATNALAASIAALMTTALTESYAADGANATVAQLLYEMRALLSEFSISGTTLTTRKKDGVTTAGTYTLDSSTSPTSITRAT
jgi:hypothetical protein